MIDSELNGLAVHVLKNALYRKLKQVYTAHFAAAEGLDFHGQIFYDVYAFKDDRVDFKDVRLDIGTTWKTASSASHATIREALEHAEAQAVWVEHRKVFEWRDGEWFYLEENDQGDLPVKTAVPFRSLLVGEKFIDYSGYSFIKVSATQAIRNGDGATVTLEDMDPEHPTERLK
jgi:hypothetical protein